MRGFLICVLALGVAVGSACKKSIELNSLTFVAWHKCSQAKFGSERLQVCFDSLVEDSRCPIGAMCVWQGVAVVKFSVSVNDSRENIILSTLNMTGSHRSDTTLMGYKFELLSVKPFPEINVPRNLSDYKAELQITRL